MRILLLAQFYPPDIGGEENHVRALAAALTARGHQVSVVTQWIPGTMPLESDGGVVVHRIRGTFQRFSGLFTSDARRHHPPFFDPELVAGLRRVVARVKPEIVHAHNWIYHSFLPLRHWSKAVFIVTLHDCSLVCATKTFMLKDETFCNGPSLLKCLSCAQHHYGIAKGVVTVSGMRLSSLVMRNMVDKFIAVSYAIARHTQLANYSLPYEVIPNFIPDDVNILPPASDYPCLEQLPEKYILFVGDLRRFKGIEVLVRAHRMLGDPPLVMIGRFIPGETPVNLPPNIYRFDPMPHAAIMHAWRRCLFGVLPSIGPEASPTVIMEAMASGRAIVASNIGGIPDLVDTGELPTGFLVPPADATKLATAMRVLITDPDLADRMGVTAAERVERLKAHSVVSQIEQIYRNCLLNKVA